MEINTDLGKIFCKYNKEDDRFDSLRVLDIDSKEETATLVHLDNDMHMVYKDDDKSILYTEILNAKEYNDFKKDRILLKSEGIISKTDIIALRREDGTDLEDVLLMFFANNKITRIPDIEAPYVVARQGINNIFAAMAGQSDQIGMSVSLETLPPDYALIDFMTNDGVLNTRLTHIYKTDTVKEICTILMNRDSEKTKNTFKRFYDNRIRFLKNTVPDFNYEPKDKDHDCIDGHCTDIETFMEESDFINDVYSTIGIIRISDKAFQENVPLDNDDKLLLATICGGIRIKKAVPLAFAYDINLEAIKVKYILALDSNNKLWIIYYLEDNELSVDELYNLTEERTKLLQERMINCIKAYDMSKNENTIKDNNIDISNIKPI